MQFGNGLFSELLEEALKRGYSFARFDDTSAASRNRCIYLRHDVDISPIGAERLGGIAAQKGIASNFFFQLNAETYTILSADNLGILSRLREQGHLVGLHIDERLVGLDEDKIDATLKWFDACCTPIDRAVSFHRPSPNVLGRSFERFACAYDSRFFHPDAYLSDSRRSLNFVERYRLYLNAGQTPIQVLLHPEWWVPYRDVDSFWEHLRRRRELELKRYLVANFTTVFAAMDLEPHDPQI